VWLGVGEGAGALGALAAGVAAELRRREVKFEDRPFEGHLTLARVRPEATGPESRTVAAAVEGLAVPTLRTRVERIVVVESVLSPKGARYADRAEARLG